MEHGRGGGGELEHGGGGLRCLSACICNSSALVCTKVEADPSLQCCKSPCLMTFLIATVSGHRIISLYQQSGTFIFLSISKAGKYFAKEGN